MAWTMRQFCLEIFKRISVTSFSEHLPLLSNQQITEIIQLELSYVRCSYSAININNLLKPATSIK